MKKTLFILFTILVFIIIIFLSQDGSRFVGINYKVEEKKLSNFKKISQFYERHINYKELVNSITKHSNTKEERVVDISKWVFKNIKKPTKNDNIIDNHPWTIVERGIGVDDQFSDLLSVLLIYSDIDSFFYNKIDHYWHPITFFSIKKNEWSIIDPYYGVYFLNKKLKFSNLDQDKKEEFIPYHLELGIINSNNFNKIFFDKDFKNILELDKYLKNILTKLPSNNKINSTHIYERGNGSRSYIQEPLHRLFYQFYKFAN